MSKIVDARTVVPCEIEPGDQMLFVVKAMVNYRDNDGALRYRIYRCRWWGDEDDVPQGDRVPDEAKVAKAIFPSLAAVGKPDH